MWILPGPEICYKIDIFKVIKNDKAAIDIFMLF